MDPSTPVQRHVILCFPRHFFNRIDTWNVSPVELHLATYLLQSPFNVGSILCFIRQQTKIKGQRVYESWVSPCWNLGRSGWRWTGHITMCWMSSIRTGTLLPSERREITVLETVLSRLSKNQNAFTAINFYLSLTICIHIPRKKLVILDQQSVLVIRQSHRIKRNLNKFCRMRKIGHITIKLWMHISMERKGYALLLHSSVIIISSVVVRPRSEDTPPLPTTQFRPCAQMY